MPNFNIAPQLAVVQKSTVKHLWFFQDETGAAYRPSATVAVSAVDPNGATYAITPATVAASIGYFTSSHVPTAVPGVWLYEARGSDAAKGEVISQLAVQVLPEYSF